VYSIRLGKIEITSSENPFFQNLFWSSKDRSAACLLVMDDNHFLIEWLAYHYHTMNLRSVTIVSDPNAQTTPRDILDRWNGLMEIRQWTDLEYMTAEEFQQARQDVLDYFGGGGGDEDNGISSKLVKHRARQRLFYYKCLRQYKLEDKHSWVLLTDTDEFVTLNYPTIAESNLSAATMDQPGSIVRFLRQHVDHTPPLQELNHENQPLYMLQSSPCIQIPRIRFGAQEADVAPQLPAALRNVDTIEDAAADSSSASLLFNASDFTTLRWKTHAAPHDYKKNKISKTLIDLSRVPMEELAPVDSIHMPIRSLCQQRRLHLRKSQSLLGIHHYLGSAEQYTYRQNDARSGNAGANERSIERWRQSQNLKNAETDDAITPWLEGFVQQSPERARQLLQGVGQLELLTSWHAYEGNPVKDRCAFLFFGLPRAYRNMVLPSIVRNLLIPNARHNCDVYVHFYEQYEEVAGRKNRGGAVDPREIFLLQHAVRAVNHKYGPKSGRNANREPIVAFTHDTEAEFWEKRGEALKRYHDTVGPDGNPAYYPWRAKTYSNSSLDNMVKQWHSVEYAFKLMEMNAKQLGVNYTRLGMFRNDAMYVTPIDIAMMDRGVIDIHNRYVVVAPFARMPINDRMIYGPYEGVKIWATERFKRIEDRVRARQDPGFEMHSEHFLNASIFPVIQALGYETNMNRDICFVRTRADESAMVSDCSVGGITRGWDSVDKKKAVEDIVRRNCTYYKMGFKWTFVGCGEGVHYQDGK
jgi:hypothetical protein